MHLTDPVPRNPNPVNFDWSLARLEHRDNLPHIRQTNVIYFVTFRLADSLPEEQLSKLRIRRDRWLHDNPKPHTLEQEKTYRRIWTARIETLMDAGHGSCILRDPGARSILESVMRRADGHHYLMGDFVIMPNHVHALLQPLPNHPLAETVKAWKSTSARKFGKECGRLGSYWMDEYFDHVVRNRESFDRFVSYIRMNPLHLSNGTFTLGIGTMHGAASVAS